MNGFLTYRYNANDWNKSNKYCIDKNYSWFSTSETNPIVNPNIKGNCTWGCCVQASEQCDYPIRINGESGMLTNAECWHNHEGFKNNWLQSWKEAQDIKAGDIISYDGWYASGKSCGGHVRYVYDIKDGKMLIGESGYQGFLYRTKWLPILKINDKEQYTSNITIQFKGALRCPFNIDKRVQRDTKKNQVTISIENLRVRKEANGELWANQYMLMGTYDVLEKQDNWLKLHDKIWIGIVDGVEYHEREDTMDVINLKYDDNYDYRWTIVGNKFGSTFDVCTLPNHYDEKLMNKWEEVLAVNGGLFYSYQNDYYACGVEYAQGKNNQDINMDAVTKYANAMCLCATYDGKLEFNQQWTIVDKLDIYYGVVTGIGLLKDGREVNWGRSEFSSQFSSVSGRTIIGEDYDGNYYSYSFSGETGTSGLTGNECVKKVKDLNLKNAILLDGGGSVARRYMGKYELQTSRKLKNAVLLYRRKKEATKPIEKPNIEEEILKESIKLLQDENEMLRSKLEKIKEDIGKWNI